MDGKWLVCSLVQPHPRADWLPGKHLQALLLKLLASLVEPAVLEEWWLEALVRTRSVALVPKALEAFGRCALDMVRAWQNRFGSTARFHPLQFARLLAVLRRQPDCHSLAARIDRQCAADEVFVVW